MSRWSESAQQLARSRRLRCGGAAIVACQLLFGCASTVRDTPVNYRYGGQAVADLHGSTQRLRMGEFEDRRGLPPRMIFQGHSLNGNLASGGDQAELPVIDIVRDALQQGLRAARAPLVTSDETLWLSGVLVASTRDILPKGFFTGENDARLTVVVTLTSTASGAVVWHETYRVSDSITSSSPTAPKNMLNDLLDKLVAKLLADDDFLHRLR